MFLRVTHVVSVGRALKSKEFIPCFICTYQISQRIEVVTYMVGLPLSLSNLHDVFHVSQLCKYIHDPSHII